MIRRLARGAFLDWLDAHDLTLSTCQQADLDHWLGAGQAVYCEEAGRFIRWARASKHAAGYFASAPRWNGPARLLDHEDRWDIARRLLHDDGLKLEDRLAGLLVLRYAQGVAATSRMTVGQIQADDGDVRLRLGRVPIQLPEPVATLAPGRHARPRRRGEPQRPCRYRDQGAITLAFSRRPARPADQRPAQPFLRDGRSCGYSCPDEPSRRSERFSAHRHGPR